MHELYGLRTLTWQVVANVLTTAPSKASNIALDNSISSITLAFPPFPTSVTSMIEYVCSFIPRMETCLLG